MNTWYRGFIQGKTRIAMAWIFVILMGFFSKELPNIPGMVLCFLGATVRFWASGYLRKDSRLAVGGPYAYIRNPLYLGTYLMAIGAILAIGNIYLFAFCSVLFAGVYHYIILDEETKLHGIFGQPYVTYCESVPRFFPRVWPPLMPAARDVLLTINPNEEHQHYSGSIARKNKAHEPYLTFVAIVAYLSLWAWLRNWV